MRWPPLPCPLASTPPFPQAGALEPHAAFGSSLGHYAIGLLRRANALGIHILVVHNEIGRGDMLHPWWKLLERPYRVGDGRIPQTALPDDLSDRICNNFQDLVLDTLSNRMPYFVQCALDKATSGESSQKPLTISTVYMEMASTSAPLLAVFDYSSLCQKAC